MDTIRPVFVRPRFAPPTIVKVKTLAADGNLEIRPANGEQWTVNFVKMFCIANGGGGAGSGKIEYVSTAGTVIIVQDTSFATGESLQVASFGNGPIVVDHNNYLKCTASGFSGPTIDIIGLAENM